MNARLRKEKRHQSQQPADTSHNNLKKKYESLQKDYKRVGQAFQNQQDQNQELTALLEEREKEAEELANIVRNKDEVIKNLKRRLLNAKSVIAELRAEVRRRDQPILGDPGAVSGGGEKSNRVRKNSGEKKSRRRRRAPGDKVLTDQFQTAGVILASDWCQKTFVFFFPITEQQD